MFAVLFEYHYLDSLPDLVGRQRTIGEHVRRLQLEHFLEASVAQDRSRKWRRISSRRRATLVTALGAFPTQVHEASAGGFRLEGSHQLMVGDGVELRAEGYSFPCKVVWWSSSLGQYGLAISGLPRPMALRSPPSSRS
jgi:hypothetical protein